MIYGLLCIIIFALVIKIYSLKSTAKEIAEKFSYILKTDTNIKIDIPSRDKAMRFLADSINKQIDLLRRERLLYEQGNGELKTAITNISHDIRTPLTTICGYLDVMKRMEKPKKIAEYLDIIDERAALMQQLTEELFGYSVILSQDDAGEIEEVFVNQVLAESISGYYAVLAEKGIGPRISISEKRIVRRLNKTALSRIFSNLLGNAVKYSGGDLEITLDDSGEIIFSNSAEGLSSAQAERLFDRFYTVETARNSTGLGLSIARTLARKMGGDMTAEYKDGKLTIRVFFAETEIS